MSIVSGLNDIIKVSVKKQPTNAVQWGQDVVPDFANAPQLPTVNQFRKIRVPSANPRAPPKGCDVPVKFMQEGDDYQRTATEMFETTKLKPAVQKTSTMDFSMLLNNQTETTSPPFNYNAGIKPSSRFLKIDEISEPSPAMFRP
jgi:hypothetical protein